VSGPFNSAREALASVRHVIDPTIYLKNLTEGNRALLRAAASRAGIELGTYDWEIVDWLAGFEVATAVVVAGIIGRAANALSPAYDLVLGQALADALAWRQALGDGEQAGLYVTTAEDLRVPGDITLGPGRWHPDCVQASPEVAPAVLTPEQRKVVLDALEVAAEYRRYRASLTCEACATSPTEVCPDHATDLDRAEEYDHLVGQIGGAR
jgi:hypothetical protein